MYGVGKTDTGMIRSNNEDSIFICNESFGNLPNVYIVADGMGGHNAGEIASKRSIQYFCEYIKNNICEIDNLLDFLVEAVSYSNSQIFNDSKIKSEFAGMGTTFTACVLLDKKLYITHVGDSRIYKFSNNNLIQLTTDHTYVNEMIKCGKLTLEEAKNHPNRNAVTRSLGVEKSVNIDGLLTDITNDDKIIVCSDGLTSMLSDQEISKFLINKISTENKLNYIIEATNKKGGEDNISIIIIEKMG